MSITKEMAQALKEEAKKRKIGTIQETMRALLGEYFMLEEKAAEKRKNAPKPQPKVEFVNPIAH